MECDAVRREFSQQYSIAECCLSCHEDAASGHGDDLWFHIEGVERHVCCAVARAFDKPRVTAMRSERV